MPEDTARQKKRQCIKINFFNKSLFTVFSNSLLEQFKTFAQNKKSCKFHFMDINCIKQKHVLLIQENEP